MNAVQMRTGVAAFAALFIIGCRERIVVTSQQGPVERISGATVVAGEPTLRLDHGPKEKPRAVFLVDGLRAEDLEALAGADEQALRQMFVLRVAEGPEDLPNLLGHYEVKDGSIRFEPRFPLQPGLRYRATFDPTRLPVTKATTGPVITEFVAAPAPEAPRTRIDHVYPSRDVVPENQLKLYVHFSAPMSRGESYRHIQLVNDDTGRTIDLPFLEIAEELWADRQTRLTLLFDPARVKRGLASREEAGPILEEGKTYTLVIEKAWPDANGRALASDLRKTFRAGPPDNLPVDPNEWKIDPPRSTTKASLVIDFPEPLDHAMLGRAMRILGPDGFPVRGSITIDRDETRWGLTPESPWKAGEHALVIDTELEDLAGNSVGRPFEIDIFQKIDRTVRTESLIRTFVVE